MKQEEIKAVIYDMDGVLIDSEPLWKIAMEKVFKEQGCDLKKKDFEQTVGLRLDEVINYWYDRKPWEGVGPKEVLNLILEEMVQLIKAHGSCLPGVRESLTFFKEQGMKLALATSSYQVLIDAVLEVLEIGDYFDLTHSAEKERFGKPHPDVYLHTAQEIGVKPINCLVIEDSLNGVIAGKAARMTVVCIPEKTHEPDPRLILADVRREDLNELIATWK
ncbi:MAG: hexitol phosphatase HxpB [Bacteroidetes bacterium]|nr:MAG: hexitol phosphatase HxpB [Bacteroidota bacterium]